MPRPSAECTGDEGAEGSLLDLLVIGAGPHALSLLCRLIDDEPDLMTEDQRTHMMAKAGTRARAPAAVRAHLKKRFDSRDVLRRVAVVDAHGSWMAQWAHDFEALQIPHCRSHADLHPCPYDFQSLRVWAEMQKRDDEMWPMHYLPRDDARSGGYTGPFTLPGSKLFLDFCRSLVDRYGLGSAVRRGVVQELRLVRAEAGPCSFEAHMADGSVLRAARVVLATGPGLKLSGLRSNMPWWCDAALTAAVQAGGRGKAGGGKAEGGEAEGGKVEGGEAGVAAAAGATAAVPTYSPTSLAERRLCHSSQLLPSLAVLPLPTALPRNAESSKGGGYGGGEGGGDGGGEAGGEGRVPGAARALEGRRVLVVGGGQSAGHLALFALGAGAARVTVAARRRVSLKPFDVDFCMVGEERGRWLAGAEAQAQAPPRP